ncbi:MAG: extracellular solute-binding protein [Chloroflexales bacterium]|nr:extracellular solute-binding protein [Chloroflexales bacterium]
MFRLPSMFSPPKLMLGIAAILLAACAAAPINPVATQAPDVPPDQVVTITFGAYEHQRPLYAPLIERFNAENPSVQVQFVPLDEVTISADRQVMQNEQALPDIVRTVDTTVRYVGPEDLTQGYFRNLKPLIDADPSFDYADYFPRAFSESHADGEIYMLPQEIWVSLLAYNKNLWAARGLPEPGLNTTWSEIVDAAQRLTVTNGEQIEVYGLMDGFDGWTVFRNELEQAGASLFNTPIEQVRFDQPELIAALQRVRSLIDSGVIRTIIEDASSGATIVSSEQIRPLAQAQRLAIWPSGQFSLDANEPGLEFEIGYLPRPSLDLVPDIYVQRGYVMSNGAQHPEAAWRWLSFLSRQLVEEDPESRSALPARASLAEQSGYWQQLDPEAAAAVRTIVEQPARMLVTLPDERIESALRSWWYSFISGQSSAEQFVDTAQQALDERLAIAQTTPQPTPDPRPLVVATPQIAAEGAAVITFNAYDRWRIYDLAQQFSQDNPMIQVQIRDSDPSDDRQGLIEAAATSDCFAWPTTLPADVAQTTLDLQALIAADQSFEIGDYPPALLAPFQRGTALYGLPYTAEYRVLYYNQAAFEAAGLPPPHSDWTLDDFANAAQRLTHTTGETQQYGYAPSYNGPNDVFFFLDRFGAAAVQESEGTLQPAFTDPQVIAALQYHVNLLRNHSPHQELPGYKSNSSSSSSSSPSSAVVVAEIDYISSGQIGMWLHSGIRPDVWGEGRQSGNGSGFAPSFIAPPAGRSGITANDIRLSGLYIAAQTEHPQACWEWLKYLSGQTAHLQNEFPTRHSIADSEAFLTQAVPGKAEVYAAYRAALEQPLGSANAPLDRSEIDPFWLFRAIDRALQGADLAVELADAQFLTEQWLACVRGGEAPDSCTRQVDPDYAGYGR